MKKADYVLVHVNVDMDVDGFCLIRIRSNSSWLCIPGILQIPIPVCHNHRVLS